MLKKKEKKKIKFHLQQSNNNNRVTPQDMLEMLRTNKSTFIKVPVRIWGFVVCPVRLLQATRGTV